MKRAMTITRFAMICAAAAALAGINAPYALAFMPINVQKMKQRVVKADPNLESMYGGTKAVKITNSDGGAGAKGFMSLNRQANSLAHGNFATIADTSPSLTAQRLARGEPKISPKTESKGESSGPKVTSPEPKVALHMPARVTPFGREQAMASVVGNMRHNELANVKDSAVMDLFGETSIPQSHPFAKGVRGSELAWPIPQNADQRLSSTFGKRMDPFSGEKAYHEGIDIVAKKGTAIQSSGDGVVVSVGKHPRLGSYVTIEHQPGLSTQYGHMGDVMVTEGQRVRQGQTVGHVGMTGRTTGPHLHYAVLVNNKHVDPLTRLSPPSGIRLFELSSAAK